MNPSFSPVLTASDASAAALPHSAPNEVHLALDWGMDAARAILCGADGRSLLALKTEGMGWSAAPNWNALRTLARDVLARSPVPVTWVRSVVLAAPGEVPASPTGEPTGRAQQIGNALRDELGIANAQVVPRLQASARAEANWGVLHGQANWLLVLLEEEISGVASVDGHILGGSRGLAANLAALCIEREGALAPSGIRGGLSAYCSARALEERARSYAIAVARPSELWEQAAHNWTARSLCEEFISRLAQGIGAAASLLNPSRVVIAGSLGEAAMRDLPEQVTLRLSSFCPPGQRDGLQVLAPHFGADTAIMGAVAFAVSGKQ